MKRNGFTLIEIIGAIVILGIIAIIAFSTYTASLRGFRENYYTNEKKTLESSAKEFFNDNRNYRPTKILNAQDVSIETLATKQYMSLVTDYNGNACDNSSYALIVNEGEGNFSYHACLICDKDGYDNTNEDIYCDKSWLDPTKVEYGIGTVDKIYIYKGTTREKLKEQLELPISYIRKNNNGKVIAERRGTREGSEILSPVDIDAVDTNTIGNYKVTYKYGVEEKTREVRVYEHKAPNILLEKENTIAKNLKGDTKKDIKKTYNPGEWTQNVIVTLSSKAFEDTSVTGKGFQWNVDGRWQDFCNSDPCTKTVTKEMNQSVQFRLIDSNDNISITTDPVIFKIDNTSPTCTLKVPTAKGDNDWYKTDVTIEFNEITDPKSGNDDTLVSGVKQYNIQVSTETLKRDATINARIQTQDTAGIKYVGYVEDEAENFSICEVTIKKDATQPSCKYDGQSTGWTKNNRTITYSCDDSLSGCVDNLGGSHEYKETTKTAVISSYIIKDNAGNTKTCEDKSVNVYVDKTEPICNYVGESTEWTKNDRKITYGCLDNESGCADGTGGGSKTFDKTTQTGRIESYVIKDKAGNQKTCGEKTVDVYVDKTEPICNYVGESTEWTNSNRKITYGCLDEHSGCADGTGGGEENYTSTKKTAKIGSYVIKDKAGNQKTCGEKTVNVYVDKTAPTCTYLGTSTEWTKDNRTIKSACSDEHSKCVSDVIASVTISETKKTVNIAKYTIQDKAGNSKVCDVKEVSAYVDKIAPTCKISGDSTIWITDDRTISYLCEDADSKCASGYTGGSKIFNTTTKIGKIGPYDIKDNAGNTNKCNEVDVNVYVGKPTKCSAGNYLDKTECKTCPAGKYCPGGTFNPNDTVQGLNDCPSGYTNGGTGKSAITQCIKKVACGKYVETAKGAEKSCNAGTYKGEHEVSYGNISACTTASPGYYVPNSGACTQSACGTGTTSEAGATSCHSVCEQTAKEQICGGYCSDSEITYYNNENETTLVASPWVYSDPNITNAIPEGKCIIKDDPEGKVCYVFKYFRTCTTGVSSNVQKNTWYHPSHNSYGIEYIDGVARSKIVVYAHFSFQGNQHCAQYFNETPKAKCQ